MRASTKIHYAKDTAGLLNQATKGIFNLRSFLSHRAVAASCLSFILSTSEATFSTQPRGIPIVVSAKKEGVDER